MNGWLFALLLLMGILRAINSNAIRVLTSTSVCKCVLSNWIYIKNMYVPIREGKSDLWMKISFCSTHSHFYIVDIITFIYLAQQQQRSVCNPLLRLHSPLILHYYNSRCCAASLFPSRSNYYEWMKIIISTIHVQDVVWLGLLAPFKLKKYN